MIYVECKPDRALVESITNIPKRGIIHESGKSRVCGKLAKQRNCKGLADEDPLSIQHPYMKKLRLEDDLSQQGIKIFHDETNMNSLFVLCPRLEDWILKAAEESKLNMGKYSLPSTPIKLHRVINLDLDKFERLLTDLRDSERLKTLRKLLEG